MRPERGRATLSSYTYAAVGVVVAVLALVFASLIVATRGFHGEARSVSDAQEVLQTSNELQRTVIDVETGLRGYLLTGEDRFLEPFDASLRSIPIQLQDLHQNVAQPDQRARLADLERVAGCRAYGTETCHATTPERGVFAPRPPAVARGEGQPRH